METNSLMQYEVRKAITTLMFLILEKDRTIKGRECANGCKQMEHILTAIIEFIFITAPINVREQWGVAILDQPGAFPHAWNDEKMIMFMKGKLAELMTHVASQIQQKYITAKTGEKSST